jgi:hypothetical protein
MAEGDLLIAPRMAWRQAGTLAGRALHRLLVGPLHGMIISTYRCNLRCSMCELWKRPPLYEKLGKKELSTMEMKKVIEDFAAIGTTGIGFTGGEPLTRPDMLELVAHVRKHRMISGNPGLRLSDFDIPAKRTVQDFPKVRTSDLSAIPSFSGKQMVVGDRLHGRIFRVRLDLYERRLEGFRRALEGLPATRNDLRRMGVDYLFWGKPEFRYFKFHPNLPVLKRIGSTILYSLVEL